MKIRSRLTRWLILLLFYGSVLAACSFPDGGQETTPDREQETVPNTPVAEETETPLPLPPLEVDRIKIRTVKGVAEFYHTGTGERFVPRGVNYVELVETERGGFEDRIMATNRYDPDRTRSDFRHLHELGYNTVRIFFDTCGTGPYCIAQAGGVGLNQKYLDNMADLMRIAGEEGIYIIFTANSVPEEGGYWPYFDGQIYGADERYGFSTFENSDWLHPAGVEIKRRFWHHLMSGMQERAAPFEVMLGWQLTNEFWLFKLYPPLSLNEGLVTSANEKTYDMADPEQKRQMVIDGTLYFMEEIVPIIKEYDPEALTTMGFFNPQFPNDTYIGGDWYVDTAPLMDSAPIDFWDFHAYFDNDLTIEQMAENYGMLGYEDKPILMGETGAGPEFVPSAATALTVEVEWIADSCKVGFDGWLWWGYYPWPEAVNGPPWAALGDDELLLKGLAPVNYPDPCVVPELEIANVAYKKPVRVSRSLNENPPQNAVDGGSLEWNAGDFPPQWIEIDLQEPTTIQRVGMNTAQWPPGVTNHRVWARLSDGRLVLLGQLEGFTTVDMVLRLQLPTPLDDVIGVRIETSKNPSWVAWREIEVVSALESETKAYLGISSSQATLYADPDVNAVSVGSMSGGQIVYLNGRYETTEGVAWIMTGGGTWLMENQLDLPNGCNLDAVIPEPRLVPVTFRVTVPAGLDDEVFMTGDFEGTDMPVYKPWMILLTKTGINTFEVTVPLPAGSQAAYVYTRGEWESIERSDSCGETNPKEFVVEDSAGMLIEDEVVKWQDLDCQ